ncbi:MAG: hypothetical protein JW900_13485 [Anaerolineae bacterium]|nr:hypothetical protein [Anaerolineae bacterium]
MVGKPVEFLSPERSRQLVELAERARTRLAQIGGRPVEYDATTLQLLDEWIDRESAPSQSLQVMWAAFLGEIFRRRHGGEWILHQGDGNQLAVLCPTEVGGVHRVDVTWHIARRIASGMAHSLALFYLREAALLRCPRDF